MICYLFPEPSYFFFSPDLPVIIYYSHIPVAIIALLLGLFVFWNGPRLLLNRLLLFITLGFSLWTFISLIAWTNVDAGVILFIWPLFAILQALIPILSIYFIYVFLYKKDISNKLKVFFTILLLPVLLFAHTNLNLSGFNITQCNPFEYEGLFYKIYYTAIGAIALIWIPVLMIREYYRATPDFKKQIMLMGIGMGFFLLSFLSLTFVITYLTSIGLLYDSRLEIYGLFGMLVFAVFITILIVKFKTFNVNLFASQALIIALVILIGAQFVFTENKTAIIILSTTLVMTGVIGIFLTRSIRREILQRDELANLANNLTEVNKRLMAIDKQKSEFVSIASHQLRSPLTSIAGYASMIREGDYGVVPAKLSEPLERIERSARFMAESIEDFLNVSRIESGNMKYNFTDFNLHQLTEHTCDDLRPEALHNGVILLFRSRLESSQGVINADQGKIQQILFNLIGNAIKYTPKGSITVLVRDNGKTKKVFVDILDTGIGMNKDTLDNIFQKFKRGDSANTVNVRGTGLGLYVALKLAQAMGGNITAHSDGEGQGSRFTLELPVVM